MKKILLILLCLTATIVASAQTNAYSVTLNQAVWNFNDYSNTKPSLSNESFVVPQNWVVGTATSTAYVPFIMPNALSTSDPDAGYDGRYCLKMMHSASASRVPVIAVMPTVSDAAYATMKLEFYAKGETQNSSNTVGNTWNVGYITTLADTLKENFTTNVQLLQTITLDRNAYTRYEIDLSTVPQGAYVCFYEGDATTIQYCYVDNVRFFSVGGGTETQTVPDAPQIEAEALSHDSISVVFGDASLNENIIGFLIYLNGTLVDSLDELAYEYYFTNLNASTTYTVGVAAVDNLGQHSTIATATVTTLELINPIVAGPATFEEYVLAPETHRLAWTEDSVYNWQSGSYSFYTTINYGGSYVTDFVVTNETSTAFSTYQDAYRSAAGGAHDGDNYAVCYVDAWGAAPAITMDEATAMTGFYVCNNTYAYSSMTTGDAIAHQFAAGDWFKLTITGWNGNTQGQSVDFYLADFRNGLTNVVDTWTWVDLSSLGTCDKVTFALSSSDNGDFGMNTPSYFCLDDFGAVAPIEFVEGPATFEEYVMDPESNYLPSSEDGNYSVQSGSYFFNTTIAYEGTYVTNFVVTNETSTSYSGVQDAYRSAAGGAHDGDNYAVCYVDAWGAAPAITMNEAKTMTGFYVCNNAYALNSMTYGDAYAHQFAEGDWFKLTVTGWNGDVQGQSVDFYLADFRNGLTNIVDTWTWVDLSSLGSCDKVTFALSSSDNGDWGMNTPSYFCLDDFGVEAPIHTDLPVVNTENKDHAIKYFDKGIIYIETPDGRRILVSGQQR